VKNRFQTLLFFNCNLRHYNVVDDTLPTLRRVVMDQLDTFIEALDWLEVEL